MTKKADQPTTLALWQALSRLTLEESSLGENLRFLMQLIMFLFVN